MASNWGRRCHSAGYRLLVLLFAVMVFPTAAPALSAADFSPIDKTIQTSKKNSNEWAALSERLETLRTALNSSEASSQQLLVWQSETGALKASIAAYVDTLQSRQQQLMEKMKTLGEQVKGEHLAITKQRDQIQQEKSTVDSHLVGYRLLQINSDALYSELERRRQELLKKQFLAQGDNSLTLLGLHGDNIGGWLKQAWHFLITQSGLTTLHALQWVNLLGLLLGGIVLGAVLRGRCLHWCTVHHNGKYRYVQMMVTALGHYAPHLMVALLLALLSQLTLFSSPQNLTYMLGVSLPLFIALWAVLHFVFRGEQGGSPLISLFEYQGRGIARTLKLLLLIGYTAFLLFRNDATAQIPAAARLLLQDVIIILLVALLLGLLHYLRSILKDKGMPGLTTGLAVLLLASLFAEITGYRNMAQWLLRMILGTSLIGFFAWFCVQLIREFFAGLSEGGLGWQQRLRNFFGYRSGESLSWLGWMYVLSVAGVWITAIYTTLLVWGISNQTLERLMGYLLEGFQVGSLSIVPLRVVVAILVFALLLAINSWLRGRLEQKWLVIGRMDRGAREALVTMTGYVGIALAILVALSVAGVKFTNLAIIAGALSVGIGFGLQNIVNNFVSGLILLFERPVKTGDWIMVGSTEGYVKRISIRSTQIQTFDRADVIVPNSELISSQVTNWMLYDPRGRVRVPVGVAYGSDTQKVRDILLAIAADQPNVITDGSVTEPKVLFLGFGDSSLNFELRAFIQNIDERLQVLSDINFAIDAAFRREGIEIPFPQRDLHLRGWPPKEEL